MFCFVDYRNRPQFKYTFRSRDKAREYLRKRKNNPLGVTAVYPDGRREYFERGLPAGILSNPQKAIRIKKGCDVKYEIQKIKTLDGLLKKKHPARTANLFNWKKNSVFSLFALGNRKVYAGLAIASFIAFSFHFSFQNHKGQNAAAQSQPWQTSMKGRVAGAFDEKTGSDDEIASLKLADDEIIFNLLGKIEKEKQEEFEKEILKYIKARPMEAMAPYIRKQPRTVAAFIVGIAMKESKFGVYAPHSGGRDFFNYWGYKGPENTTTSGYS